MPTLKQVTEEAEREKQQRKVQAWDAPYGQWAKTQDPKYLRETVETLRPTIDSAVTSYAGQSAPPTVRQRARILAARAVRTYDPKSNAQLQTHVFSQLRALQRMTPQITDPIPLPERLRRQGPEIARAYEDLNETLGREPTDEEISDVSGIPLKRVIKVSRQLRARVPLSSLEGDDEDESPDQVENTREPYDDWVDAVYHDLGEIDQLILQYRTGYRGSPVLKNQDIAQRLNVSPVVVSQRAARIQQQLDAYHAAAPRY